MTAGPFFVNGLLCHLSPPSDRFGELWWAESWQDPPRTPQRRRIMDVEFWTRRTHEGLPVDDIDLCSWPGLNYTELLMGRIRQAHHSCEHAVLEALSR